MPLHSIRSSLAVIAIALSLASASAAGAANRRGAADISTLKRTIHRDTNRAARAVGRNRNENIPFKVLPTRGYQVDVGPRMRRDGKLVRFFSASIPVAGGVLVRSGFVHADGSLEIKANYSAEFGWHGPDGFAWVNP